MRDVLAFILATSPSLSVPEQLLHVLIYDILGPAVYLIIVLVGVELAWPGGTRLRSWLQQHRPATASDVSLLAEDSTFRVECAVAGLIALSVLAVVITLWLAGHFRFVTTPVPKLSEIHIAVTQNSAKATPTATIVPAATPTTTVTHQGNNNQNQGTTPLPNTLQVTIFAIALLLGLISGFGWAQGMRRAGGPRTSLIALSISMSLASTLLFFYLAVPKLQDTLVVFALGLFVGELAVGAWHPTFLSEGLFAELFIPAQPSTSPLAGLLGGNKSPTAGEGDDYYARVRARSNQRAAQNESASEGGERRTARLGE
jgi:hypothetical protein